jgi:hypothetical protein
MPYEAEFDPKLASHLHIWIWIRRGVGEIYVKRSGVKGGKGLDIKEILDREQKWLKENTGKDKLYKKKVITLEKIEETFGFYTITNITSENYKEILAKSYIEFKNNMRTYFNIGE